MLLTDRMTLVPFSAPLLRAEIADRPSLPALLGARVPDDWPPVMLVDALPWFLDRLEANPEPVGWLGWYGLLREEGAMQPILAGSAGFKGPPDAGTVEIGYSILPGFQKRGLGTEMVAALLAWAFQQPGVARVIAETEPANLPSLRLLSKLGFVETGPGTEPGHIRLERRKG